MLESRFEVLAAVRSDKKWKEQPKSIRVVHFSSASGKDRLRSPRYLDFWTPTYRRGGITVETAERITHHSAGPLVRDDREQPFLVFLSALPDGRYQPVTGQNFPKLAFRLLDESL